MVQNIDHSLTVGFMIVNNFNIDNINCDQNIEDKNKWKQSIKYNIVINKYFFETNNMYL